MEMFGLVIMLVGIVVVFVGGVFFLIAAFGESVLWGAGSLFVPFVSLIFLFKHWDKAKGPFFTQLTGGLLIIVGVAMSGGFSEETPAVPAAAPATTSWHLEISGEALA